MAIIDTSPQSADPIRRRISELTAEIETYEAMVEECVSANQMPAAVAAQKSVTQLRAARADCEAQAFADSITDPLERVRFLGRRASAAGSYVAAKDLYREERELAEERKRREEEEAKAARQSRSPDEAIAGLVQKVAAMPESMQAKIRAGLGWGG